MHITLNGITKKFGSGPTVLQELSFRIESGEMFFLLGPSGCGKTTVLRLLAGFMEPDAGEIFFAERKMNGVPPQERPTALVFQNYTLWPHLTVYENVAYGPRAKKLPEREVKKRVESALVTVRVEKLAERRPHQLSGGQQQRIALARALAAQPGLLLLDEPLSNLDARLRQELRLELQRIHAETGLTMLFVTHDQEEALALAQKMAILQEGRLLQIGTPQEIYEFPTSAFVAGFVGDLNLFHATSPLAAALGLRTTQSWGFRPEQVVLGQEGLPATVQTVTYLGQRWSALLKTETGEVLQLSSRQKLSPGEIVRWSVPACALMTFLS